MDTHVRQVGFLLMGYGIAALLLGVLVLMLSGGIAGLLQQMYFTGFGIVITGLILYNLVLAIPTIVAAFGLLRYENWARMLTIVISGLNILNVPVGSVIAAYALWVLLTPETEPLFLDPEPMRRVHGVKRSAPQQQEEPNKPGRVVPSKADLQH